MVDKHIKKGYMSCCSRLANSLGEQEDSTEPFPSRQKMKKPTGTRATNFRPADSRTRISPPGFTPSGSFRLPPL